MRKLLLLLLLSFISNYLFSQAIDSRDVEWILKDNKEYSVNYEYSKYGSDIIISDGLVEFKFTPKSSSIFWDCKISNIGSDKIIIKWNESAMGAHNVSKIVFGDMNSLDMKRETPDALLYKDSYISKDIAGSYYIGDSYMLDMVRLKDMKKDFKNTKMPQTASVTIIIPIEYNNNQKIYKFVFSGEYRGKINK